MSRGAAALLAFATLAVGIPNQASAQAWSVDVSAGRFVYDPVSASVGTNNLIGSIRYDAHSEAWMFGAVGAPLGDQDTFWAATGAGGRITLPGSEHRRVTGGADLSANAFSFRDSVADQIGTGGTAEAMPFARLSGGAASAELRAGWRGHTLSFAGDRQNRHVFETGLRGTYGRALQVRGDARWVHASEGMYPFVGATLLYDGPRLQTWAQTGRWLSDTLDAVSWGAGTSLTLAPPVTIWVRVQQEASDPLYWNTTRRTWSIGMTRQLGGVSPRSSVSRSPRSVEVVSKNGAVIVRLRVTDAPTGEVAIAGDFSDWRPIPMALEGGQWVIRLPLAPGVYHYAFRAARGDWFLPSSTPGARDDGMGGRLAVMVVS
jgi:hypothetical protein